VLTLDTRGQAPRAYWGGYAVARRAFRNGNHTRDEWEKRANLRVNAVVPGTDSFTGAGQTHRARTRQASNPTSLVPLYLYLLGAQPKSESGIIVDAQAWLAGQAASTSLLRATGAGAGCNAIQHAVA
jgi:hypothetical protein